MAIKFNHSLSIIAVMFLWAICYPLITVGVEHAPHITFAAYRASIAGVFLLVLGLISKKTHPQGILQWILIVFIGIGATSIGFYGMFHASEFVSPGIATVITNFQPMLTAILAFWLLKEKINQVQTLAILLGFIGILIITSNNSQGESSISLVGFLYLIVAISGISISNILMKKLSGEIDALTAMGWQLTIGSLFLWAIAVFSEPTSEVNWSKEFIFSLSILSLFGTSLAYWLWFRVLNEVSLMYANAYSFLVPAFGVSIGSFFFDESFSPKTIIGLMVIFTGIVLINLPNKERSDAG